jgi:hypothetical protein
LQAIDLIEVDVVLLDIDLLDIDGYSLAPLLRASGEKNAPIFDSSSLLLSWSSSKAKYRSGVFWFATCNSWNDGRPDRSSVTGHRRALRSGSAWEI